jgi:hypothetical protein
LLYQNKSYGDNNSILVIAYKSVKNERLIPYQKSSFSVRMFGEAIGNTAQKRK